MRNRRSPTFEEAVIADPHLKLSARERAIYIQDFSSKSSRYLLPIVRILCLVLIHGIRFVKRYIPFTLSSHFLLNKLGVFFMGKLISKEGREYIIKHFLYESALINFVVDNVDSDQVHKVDLFPTKISELGNVEGVNAIMQHDINIYNHIIDTGQDTEFLKKLSRQIPLATIDFSALDIPEAEINEEYDPWYCLDLDTGAYIMIVFLFLYISDEEGQRAALSLQFDESLMASLSKITGDAYFNHLCPIKYTNWHRYHLDPVKDLRFHMMTVDYSFNMLMEYREKQRRILDEAGGKSSEMTDRMAS